MNRGYAMLAILACAVASCTGGVASPPALSAPGSSAPPPAPSSTRASSTPIPGCLPDCVPGAITEPGPLRAGDYTTENWFGGQFTVTIPATGWSSFEDSTGELGLRAPSEDEAGVQFWLDVYPIVDGSRTPVEGIEPTVDGIFDWLEANPNLEATARGSAVLGGLRAESIDLRASDDAKNVDPECPPEHLPCVGLFGFPQWDGTYSQGGSFQLRVIAADVTWGGEEHAVFAVIEAPDQEKFDALASTATDMIETARLPEGVSN